MPVLLPAWTVLPENLPLLVLVLRNAATVLPVKFLLLPVLPVLPVLLKISNTNRKVGKQRVLSAPPVPMVCIWCAGVRLRSVVPVLRGNTLVRPKQMNGALDKK